MGNDCLQVNSWLVEKISSPQGIFLKQSLRWHFRFPDFYNSTKGVFIVINRSVSTRIYPYLPVSTLIYPYLQVLFQYLPQCPHYSARDYHVTVAVPSVFCMWISRDGRSTLTILHVTVECRSTLIILHVTIMWLSQYPHYSARDCRVSQYPHYSACDYHVTVKCHSTLAILHVTVALPSLD